ncbi:MAG: glutamate--tRNA ligase family protein, partial [Cyanobacteria bacterium J06641_5]
MFRCQGPSTDKATDYRGRIAPTPSGYLHLGHAQTFWIAHIRALHANGCLVFRMEDLDRARCKPEYRDAALEDLHWLGVRWQEGPDLGGPHSPYTQCDRLDWYRQVWQQLYAAGAIYPSPHSRKDVARALSAPHEGDREIIFPPALRPQTITPTRNPDTEPGTVNWRFCVPDGEEIVVNDCRLGPITYRAGVDFGDFIVWRKDGFPSYELAVVADDRAMEITEIVRGEDLLLSAARQLLLYRALDWTAPTFFHCPLVRDDAG